MSNDTTSGGLFGRAFDMLRNAALDPDGDPDGDWLSNAQERRLGSDPRRGDTDGDGDTDGLEVMRGTSPVVGVPGADAFNEYVDPALAADDDRDGLRNIEERSFGTDPQRADTDGDGRGDFEETFGEPDGRALDPTHVDANAMRDDKMAAAALRAVGTDYRWGAEADGRDASPDAFDSSELAEWTAAQAGIDLPDGSWNQFRTLHQAGAAVSVEEAIHTKGALLFRFDDDPLTSDGRPRNASVVISMGDGTVVHASQNADEVVRESAAGYRFTHAAEIPGMHTPRLPGDDGPPDVEVPAEIDDPTWVPPADDELPLNGAPAIPVPIDDAPTDEAPSYYSPPVDDGASYDDGDASYDAGGLEDGYA